MSEARAQILARIAATAGASPAGRSEAHSYRQSGALGRDERIELFCQRVDEYRADVRRAAEAELPAVITTVCAARNATRLVVPDGIPSEWRRASVELLDDHGLSARELDMVDGALTGCTVAIAETGTIILAARAAEGRRAISLVPDLHICIVYELQIVELLPEAVARLADEGLERRPLTLISGPSATSDIELSRVEGVHGPRDLVVLVVKESS
jgi:L-lactate dehydrogenase complex protein LldG